MKPDYSIDEELATTVRDRFHALRRAVHVAQQAGLRVTFRFEVEDLLEDPERSLPVNYVTIVRPV